MTTPTQSGFILSKYLITHSSIDILGIPENESNYEILIDPSGVLSLKDRVFKLNLKVSVRDELGKIKVKIEASAEFTFEDIVPDPIFELNNKIPDLFILNAPAIIFPHIRAYLSTLTMLSGVPVSIPVMNLQGLHDVLEERIKILR
jgi:preprotein translocase subunit SecB